MAGLKPWPPAVALLACGLGLAVVVAQTPRPSAAGGAAIAIDSPTEGTVFPPDFAPPTFLWRDPAPGAVRWSIEVGFDAGAAPLRFASRGPRLKVGEIDPRCVSATNQPPRLTPRQAAMRTWTPDPQAWAAMLRNAGLGTLTLTISGYPESAAARPVSRGRVRFSVSKDPVGAPIFYRDVPLMPSETEKGVIKPLASSAVPLIAWRLRDVSKTSSRVLMQGIHSCANCHSASLDGSTLGMDLDGPQNDKGLYALFRIQPQAAIRSEDLIAWSTFRGKLGGKLRVGFMSQVSPDGRSVVTMINDPGVDQSDYQRRKNPQDLARTYYVANFKDYRFLQVFYPTRGILAWYSRETGRLEPLPGADDPRYVHTNAVWSPDGQYLVFARAEARDPYPPGSRMAGQANDPNETPLRYDLYRIPFNQGRGGRAEPLAGASANGMSNSFPKVSPDGRWIVFVKCRNGLLMRPDSELWIVPAQGGEARRMRCNTPLMNSWHSFSPNGRWMVFSSKSRSPYTQMFLTHIDEQGNDSPAVLVENATAANRAVNIPEFLNIPPDGLARIDAPVTEYFRLVDTATELARQGRHAEAAAEWKKAVELSPGEALAHFNLGNALEASGRPAEAETHFRRALELSPEHAEAHNNLGNVLAARGALDQAMEHFARAVALNPAHAGAHSNLGAAFARQGRTAEAIPHFRRSVELEPGNAEAHNNLGVSLAISGDLAGAVGHIEQAVKLSGGGDPLMLDLLARLYAQAGRLPAAVESARRALALAERRGPAGLAEGIRRRLAQYQAAAGGR